MQTPSHNFNDHQTPQWDHCADALMHQAANAAGNNTNLPVDPAYRQPITRQHRARPVIRLNLVSMIDVVFQLLMYFMLTTNFSAGEAVFDVHVPATAQGAQKTNPFSLPEPPINIVVTTTGPGRWDYALRIDMPGAPSVTSFESLFRWLDDNQVRSDHPGGLFTPDNPVHIEPGRNTRWEHTVSALNACLRAKYTKVQLVAPQH